MTAKKREAVIAYGVVTAWLLNTLAAKVYLFPERSYFELLLTGFAAHTIVCGIVGWALSAIIKVDDE